MPDYGDLVEPCLKREYVIIADAEDHYEGKYYAGNRLMFFAQAVRYVRRWGSFFDLTTALYFPGQNAYTSAQREAFERAVKKYGGEVKAVTTWDEVAAHINQKTVTVNGKTCQKRVQVLIFFSHGTPNFIWLSDKEQKYFTTREAAKIDSSSFASTTGSYSKIHATSWACQTGNAGDRSKTIEQNMASSLAQSMADMWKIEVRATARRTDYSATWAGRPWSWFNDRVTIDGAVWQETGADGGVWSGEGGASTSEGTMPSGLFKFLPGQSGDYDNFWSISID